MFFFKTERFVICWPRFMTVFEDLKISFFFSYIHVFTVITRIVFKLLLRWGWCVEHLAEDVGLNPLGSVTIFEDIVCLFVCLFDSRSTKGNH